MNKKAIIEQLSIMAEAMEIIESLLAEDKNFEEPKKNQWGRKAIKVLGKSQEEPKAEAEGEATTKIDTTQKGRDQFWKDYDHPKLKEGDGVEYKKYLYHFTKFNKKAQKYSEAKLDAFLEDFRSGKAKVSIEDRTAWLVRENKKAKAAS
jgi:hypothetical protein